MINGKYIRKVSPNILAQELTLNKPIKLGIKDNEIDTKER